MLTKTEMQKILDQVNDRFDYLTKKIERLEKELDKPKQVRSTKKVEEST